MKLGVFINQAFYNYNGKISTDLSFVRFIESFGATFSEIKLFAPTKIISRPQEQGLYFCAENIVLCQLPYYENVKDLVKKSLFILPRSISLLRKEIKEIDRLWIVGPHPLGIFAGFYANRYNVPSFVHIRGNILNDVKVRYNNSMVGKAYARYMHWGNCFLSRRMTALTVGSELFNLYKNEAKKIAWISPSLINEDDIKTTRAMLNQKKPQGDRPLRLLFVGRVEPEKGLEYLFQALKTLNQNPGRRFELIIVGGAQRGSEDKEHEIRRDAEKMGISESITWKGYVPYGEDIKKIYRSADIFILPSLAEGIPKVIYEALAFGLPIISTDVGGISDVVQNNHNGILIKPASKEAIVYAVNLLTERNDLKNRLIENGLKKAEKLTIEAARQKIIEIFNQ